MDLTNKRFGKLVAISIGEPRKSPTLTYKTWRCICDCGNEIETKTNQLTSGKTKSCGCLRSDIKPRNNITNKRFGRLTVGEPISRDKHRRIKWLCVCDCGEKREFTGNDLLSGKIQSCGCLWKERISKIGEDHFRWNKLLSENDRLINRRYFQYNEWRDAIFKRDNYACQICNSKKSPFNAHHIENYSNNIEKRTSLENGITMCKKCHIDFHHTFSRQNNNLNQLQVFKGDR